MDCKEILFSKKIRDYYGSWWVGPGLTRNFFWKSSQNNSKPVLIFWSIQEKSLDGGWVGGVSSIQVYFGFLNFFFNFSKPIIFFH